MIQVGVIGMGMMGSTHLDVYAKHRGVNIAAVSDLIPDLLYGQAKASGNIEGQAKGGVDLSQARKYDEGMKLIADKDVELVDICLPTPLHYDYALAALKAGKHVMVEKPMCRTAQQAYALADAAEKADKLTMVGMCMRFWPGWDWLKQVIDEQRFGRVLAAQFRRVAQHPNKGFYLNGDECGGALLDLHIHDSDFVQYCFGKPQAVFSRGYAKPTSAIDHVITQYLYDDGPLVTAEGGWAMNDGFGFSMQYTVNFERATAMFDMAGSPVLKLARGGKIEPVEVEPGMGYEHEIAYFLDCIAHQRQPKTVTMRSAADSVKLVEAELASVNSGQVVKLS